MFRESTNQGPLQSRQPQHPASTFHHQPQPESIINPDLNHSVERSRKRIFSGRSKSRNTRPRNESISITVQPNDNKLLQKMQQMQHQITTLTEILSQKQKRQVEEQRRIKEILLVKDKEVKAYTMRIQELTGELGVKEREINVYKLEVERLRRWKKIEMDREQLSVAGGGVGGDSFLGESAGKRSYKELSVSRGSPGGFERGMFIKPEDFQIQNTPTDQYLSPFSVANLVSERPQSRSSISNYRSNHSPQPRNLQFLTIPNPAYRHPIPPNQLMVLTAKPTTDTHHLLDHHNIRF